MIEVISPAGFEGFFRELVAITDIRRPDSAEVGAIGDRYGLRFAQPDWLAGVIERYELAPPARG
jgi:hypothetical protein